jgi:hypothetical protein
MNSLRGNREQLAVVTASLAVLVVSFAAGLVRRQHALQASSHSRALVRPDPIHPADRCESAQSKQEEEDACDDMIDGKMNGSSSAATPTTVDGDARGAAPPGEQVKRGKNVALLPVAERAAWVLCSLVMLFLGVKGHVYVAVVVLLATALFHMKFRESVAASPSWLSNTSKLEVREQLWHLAL